MPTLPFDLLLRGGTCVTPSGRVRVDVGVRKGRVAALGDFQFHPAAEVLDVAGLHVLPGVIDSQVHFREPGLTHKEDLGSGSASAALGGVTTFLEMPNTSPSTTTAEALAWKVARARATAFVDFGFFVGASKDNVGALAALERLPGCVGVKLFLGSSTGSLLVDDWAVVEQVLCGGSRRVAVHSEEEARLQERRAVTAGKSVHVHPEWRDVECATRATSRLLELAASTGRRVHVLHVSTAEELPLLEAAKHKATLEVTPQHLTLASPDCYERLGTKAQMNPPLRDARHRDALWTAVRSGIVDVLGSDHAPHTLEEKAKPYPESPSGMPGVQTLVPVMLSHVAAGQLTLERFVDLASAGPARVYGLARKGRLAVGYDADFTVVDLKASWTITNAWSQSRCGWTPFDGFAATGRPWATVVRGRLVMRDGQLLGSPSGAPVELVE